MQRKWKLWPLEYAKIGSVSYFRVAGFMAYQRIGSKHVAFGFLRWGV